MFLLVQPQAQIRLMCKDFVGEALSVSPTKPFLFSLHRSQTFFLKKSASALRQRYFSNLPIVVANLCFVLVQDSWTRKFFCLSNSIPGSKCLLSSPSVLRLLFHVEEGTDGVSSVFCLSPSDILSISCPSTSP